MRALGTLVTAVVVVTGPATVPARAQAAPEGRVVGADAPGAIPGRYIVTLKDGVTAQASAAAAGGAGTFVADLTAAQARRLAADPDVRLVEQDRVLSIRSTQKNPPWGLDRIDQRPVRRSATYTPTDDGSAVHAYVIDTGVRITHAEFGGRATYGYDAVDGDQVAADCNGHGTHVAGTIGGAHYGVAKKVRLVAVRVLDCTGQGTLSQVISGVNWVTAHAVRPAVANMSMGGDYSPSIEAAVQRSINAGITYVVAAGNEDTNATDLSPAGLPAAITVGATDAADRRASFSNFGPSLDLFAPGVGIRSSVSSSDTATAVYNGTSMASPHVAGAAALALDANPSLTPAQVRNQLVARATTGKVTDRAGSPNRLLFVPAPPARPVIRSSAVTMTAGQASTTRLTLAANRRGTWSLVAGRLPGGVRLSAAGVLSGTPTGPGTATVKVRFVDYVPYAVTKVLTVTVRRSVPVIATTDPLPQATAGMAYREQLTVTDRRDGTWSLAAGTLPDGLALLPTGVVEGVPAGAGTTFTVAFRDAWGTVATKVLTIGVVPAQ